MFWKLTIALVAIAGISGAVYLSGVSRAKIRDTITYLEKSAVGAPAETSPHAAIPVTIRTLDAWDGLVALTADEKKAIGVRTEPVEKQKKPIKLELTGRTAYDENTLTRVRLRFDASVEKVYVALGQKLKAGEKLVDLHSTDLAAAKSDFQSKFVQWQHDKNLLDVRADLVKKGAISKKEFVDTQNDEQKSHLDFILAGDKLRIYKVLDADIDALLKGLKDTSIELHQFGSVEDKAMMTLVSPVDGIVIERGVVAQNFYETGSVLMTIAPLDHLWVQVNVYELDQDKVALGQTMEIQFPFMEEKITGRVQYVANEVSKETRAVRVRATIPNPEARLKADMVVKAMLDIKPVEGQTVVPRLAMVSSNGKEYVFVRRPHPDEEPSAVETADKFDRRRIVVAQEGHDKVVVHRAELACDLRLIPPGGGAGGIPTVGKDLVIVAAVDKVLHFRIFDGAGKMIVDTDEKGLTDHARPIEELRKQLDGLWPPHEPTDIEKYRVITAVAPLVGYTPVARTGLLPDEEVVTNGSLILAQLYEDMRTVQTGQPAE